MCLKTSKQQLLNVFVVLMLLSPTRKLVSEDYRYNINAFFQPSSLAYLKSNFNFKIKRVNVEISLIDKNPYITNGDMLVVPYPANVFHPFYFTGLKKYRSKNKWNLKNYYISVKKTDGTWIKESPIKKVYYDMKNTNIRYVFPMVKIEQDGEFKISFKYSAKNKDYYFSNLKVRIEKSGNRFFIKGVSKEGKLYLAKCDNISMIFKGGKNKKNAMDLLKIASSVYDYIRIKMGVSKKENLNILYHFNFRQNDITPFKTTFEGKPTVNGFFSMKEHSVFLRASTINEIKIPILAHELTHAIAAHKKINYFFFYFSGKMTPFFDEMIAILNEEIFSLPSIKSFLWERNRIKAYSLMQLLPEALFIMKKPINERNIKWIGLKKIASFSRRDHENFYFEIRILTAFILSKYGLKEGINKIIKYYEIRNAKSVFGESLDKIDREVYSSVIAKLSKLRRGFIPPKKIIK